MDGQFTDLMTDIGQKARAAAAELAFASSERKAAALVSAAAAVWDRRQEILDANCLDLDYGTEKGLSPAMMDRLKLDEARIRGIVDGLRAVAEQRDPMATRVADIMSLNLHTADISARVEECERRMRAAHVRHLPILDQGKVVACLSLRDLLQSELKQAVLEVQCDECETALNFDEIDEGVRRELLLTLGAR